MIRIEIFKRTHEDWYPSYYVNKGTATEEKLLKVSFLQLSNGQYRCCVWGNDDKGMDFDTKYEAVARDLFHRLAELDSIIEEDLKLMGFVPA